MNKRIAKFLYGLIFVVLIPLFLFWWASVTNESVSFPEIRSVWLGAIVAAVGLTLLIAGFWALKVYGNGLPMNAFPPPRYVSAGVYRFLAHPIYLGFGMLSSGTALALGSPSGLWLVSPVVWLAMLALVQGYENHDLEQRFGKLVKRRPLISIPPNSHAPPTAWDRLSIYLLVFLPWLVTFELVYLLGVPSGAETAYLAFEQQWPVWEWTEIIYASGYLLVIITPLLLGTQQALRQIAITGLLATAVVTFIYLVVPVISPPRPFQPSSLLGELLIIERAMASTTAAFPAFHVIWALISANALAKNTPAWSWAFRGWTALVILSCITTGMHALADIVAAIIVFLFLSNIGLVWSKMRDGSQKIANSWRVWRWHGVRLINHGIYAALAGTLGFWIVGMLGGNDVFWSLVFIYVCSLFAAGLWAQRLEGSSKLSRPFGYFGSLIGAVVGCFIAGTLTGNTMLLLALMAISAPWTQAVGRLRCLVQGCCHGRPSSEKVGIRYQRSHSRVCTIAELYNVPLHPTPLYSIIANLVIGIFLIRLWVVGVPLSMIAGCYLIFTGAARFVEESYRGEPQTPIIWGMRIYQWTAVLSFTVGIILTTIPSDNAPGVFVGLEVRFIVTGILCGLLSGMAMGVDFPNSARRFARLAPP